MISCEQNFFMVTPITNYCVWDFKHIRGRYVKLNSFRRMMQIVGPCFNTKISPCTSIPMIKISWLWNRVILIMGSIYWLGSIFLLTPHPRSFSSSFNGYVSWSWNGFTIVLPHYIAVLYLILYFILDTFIEHSTGIWVGDARWIWRKRGHGMYNAALAERRTSNITLNICQNLPRSTFQYNDSLSWYEDSNRNHEMVSG